MTSPVRRTPLLRLASIGLLLLALAACSHLSDTKPSPPKKSDPRAQLSIGYSLLYQEADGIPKLKWLFMLKDKTSEMATLTNDLISYYQDLADRMKQMSGQYPAMRINVEALSPIEGDTRKAIGLDQAKEMAPIAGNSGTEFERQALLMFYDALNEQRHLVGVMLEQEPSPALKKFLESTKEQLDERHAKVGVLLDRRYFTH